MFGKSESVQRSTTILLVDDRPENLMAMEAVLEPLGFEIAKVISGLEALKYLLGHEVALIVLDVRMPVMDGFETASFIQQRERTRYVPIVFVTANSVDERDLLRAHMAGGVDYIAQPMRPAELERKVRLIMDQRLRTDSLAGRSAVRSHISRDSHANGSRRRLGYGLDG